LRAAQIGHRLVTELVALSGIGRSPLSGLRVLMYHAVGGRAHDDRFNYYSISPERFTRHMDALLAFPGLSVVPLGPPLGDDPRARVALTFDDGYRDNLTVAAPILAARGIPFTVFVAARLVKDGFPGFLSPAELKELAQIPGVSIGAHGSTHVPLAGCDPQGLFREVRFSKAYLEDLIGRPVTSMSYPHGSVNREVREAVAAAGYTLAACSHAGINGAGRDPLLLSRTEILSHDDERFFRRKLSGCWDWPGRLRHDPAAP
jgi:peptidoglycan/xylan/chitin deacetylase (PgdA/CDA1 family)